MELTVKNLKEILYETIGQDLINEGFSFSKSAFEFRKTIGEVKIKVIFFIYDYKPVWLSFTYNFNFSLFKDLEKEHKNFLKFLNKEVYKGGLLLVEGSFHMETKNMARIYQTSFVHKIFEIKKDTPEINDCRQIFREDFLPMVQIFTNREKFTNYILQNHNEVLRFGSLFFPALIVAKLEGKGELEKLVEYILANRKNPYDEIDHHQIKLLNDFVTFAKPG